MANKKSGWTLERLLPYLVTILGLVGVIASAILTVEYIKLLKNPHYVPVCNLNPIFSCSSVTSSDQAHAFGIPNELIGLAGFGGVTAIGLALAAGAQFKRWYWKFINGGLLLAVAFLTWLQFETIYRIGALCLFCMVTWAATIPLFWYVSIYNIRHKNIILPAKLRFIFNFAVKFHTEILISWYLLIIILILKRFWYYFGHL